LIGEGVGFLGGVGLQHEVQGVGVVGVALELLLEEPAGCRGGRGRRVDDEVDRGLLRGGCEEPPGTGWGGRGHVEGVGGPGEHGGEAGLWDVEGPGDCRAEPVDF